MKLTVKQQSFVDNYLANGGNGTQAAKDAGYKGSENTLASTAKENLRKPQIKEAIEKEQNKIKKKLEMTAEWKRSTLKDVIERCLQAEPVMEMRDGKLVETGEYKFGANEVIRAINELNKMDGDHAAIKNKTEVTVIDHAEALRKARERAKKK